MRVESQPKSKVQGPNRSQRSPSGSFRGSVHFIRCGRPCGHRRDPSLLFTDNSRYSPIMEKNSMSRRKAEAGCQKPEDSRMGESKVQGPRFKVLCRTIRLMAGSHRHWQPGWLPLLPDAGGRSRGGEKRCKIKNCETNPSLKFGCACD